MTKAKTNKQRRNTGNKRDMKKLNEKTLAKEVVPKVESVDVLDLQYPPTLKNEQSKLYFDAIKDSCANLSILVHEQDKFLMAKLARLMTLSDSLLEDAELNPTIVQPNVNTGIDQIKINPKMTLFVTLDRRIDALVKQLGLSPAARADIFNKMIALKSDDVFDEKTAKVINEDTMQPGIYAVGNGNIPFRKLG